MAEVVETYRDVDISSHNYSRLIASQVVTVLRYSCIVRDTYLTEDNDLDSLKRQIDHVLDPREQ